MSLYYDQLDRAHRYLRIYSYFILNIILNIILHSQVIIYTNITPILSYLQIVIKHNYY